MDVGAARGGILFIADSLGSAVPALLRAHGIAPAEAASDAFAPRLQAPFAGIFVAAPMAGAFAIAQAIRATPRHRITPLVLIAPSPRDAGKVAAAYELGGVDILDADTPAALLVAKARGLLALAAVSGPSGPCTLVVSGERLDLALKAAGLGVWSWDAATDLVSFSERAAEIFGIPPDSRPTWTALQALLHPADRERTRREVERVIAGRLPYDIEYLVLHPAGQVWVGALGHAQYDAAGRVIGMHGAVRDVTARKDLERSLRDSEARFRSLMEQAPFSVQVLAPDGRTLRVNRSWEALWGLRIEDLEGFNLLEDPQLERNGVADRLRAAFEGTPSVIPAVRYDPREAVPGRAHGEDPVRWVAAVAYPIRDAEGTVREVVLVHDDVTASRRAERALAESEAKLRLLADTIPQLAWMASPDGRVFWRNRRWHEYAGTDPEAPDDGEWLARVHPADAAAVDAAWRRSLATGEPFEGIFPLRAVGGGYQIFLTRIHPLRGDDGQIVHWIGTATDVTELRRTREALSNSEERLRLALEAGRMGVWDWNVRTNELQWSDSLEPLHGLAPGQFQGTFEHFQQLIHPDDRAAVSRAIVEALERKDAFQIEFRNVWPDGTLHWIAGSGKVFADEGGVAARMIGIGMDVTHRRRAEQNAAFLAAASATLAEIVDFDSTLQKVAALAVPAFADGAAVDVLDADGTLRRVAVAHHDAAQAAIAHGMLRPTPPLAGEATGVWRIVQAGEPMLVPDISDAMLQASARDAADLAQLRSFGLRSYIGVPLTVRGKARGVLSFVTAGSGHVYDARDLALARELSQRTAIAIENAELYEELRQADRRKDEFLATLAHELRNPLAPIRNGLTVMRLAGQERPEVVQARTMMERQVMHLVRLVDDLLDVSRITRNRLELRLEPVALADVLASAVETSRPLLAQAGHALDLELPEAAVHLHADRVRLAQVFSNLLNNAAKYTPPGGRIVVSAAASGDEVAIRVRDNGVGIPAAALERVFEMFSQVEHHAGRSQGGLGIGLTLARRLVEMHGGRIEAHSEGEGRGSEFVVRLPVRTVAPEVVSPEAVAPPPAPSPHRVLVVDDNRDAAETLGMTLEMLGHDVRLGFDGPEVLPLAREFRPDLILLDLGLPSMSGYDVCRALRAQDWGRDLYIVALTGWGQDADRRRSREAGFDMHLVKPAEIDVLAKLLERMPAPPARP